MKAAVGDTGSGVPGYSRTGKAKVGDSAYYVHRRSINISEKGKTPAAQIENNQST